MRQFGHLPELYEDARSEKYIKKMAASSSQGPFTGMIRKGNINTSLETASRSRIEDRQLLSLDNCSIFSDRICILSKSQHKFVFVVLLFSLK